MNLSLLNKSSFSKYLFNESEYKLSIEGMFLSYMFISFISCFIP